MARGDASGASSARPARPPSRGDRTPKVPSPCSRRACFPGRQATVRIRQGPIPRIGKEHGATAHAVALANIWMVRHKLLSRDPLLPRIETLDAPHKQATSRWPSFILKMIGLALGLLVQTLLRSYLMVASRPQGKRTHRESTHPPNGQAIAITQYF